MPDYWKGKVAKSSRTDTSYGKAWEVWPNGLKQYPILSMHVVSGGLMNGLLNVPSIGTVRFKSGQTARVVGLQNSYLGFVVRLNNGNCLIGSTSDYGRAIPDRGIPYSAANIAVVEDLQSLGSMSYNWNSRNDVVLACLQAIASRTTLA